MKPNRWPCRPRLSTCQSLPSRHRVASHALAFAVMAAVISAACHSTAFAVTIAGQYEFTYIAEAKDYPNSTFYTFKGAPTITADGTVVFAATRSGADPAIWGIFASRGGAVETILDTTGPFKKMEDIAVNDQGDVAFWGYMDDGTKGIYKTDGTTWTTIADRGDGFYSLHNPVINNAGQVAFQTKTNSSSDNVTTRRGDGGPLTTIADDSGQFSDFFGPPSINNSGEVAFRATLRAGGEGVFISDGTTTATIYDTNDDTHGDFSSISYPVLNDAGQVAFLGTLDGVSGFYRGDGGPVDVIADTAGPIHSIFAAPTMSDDGDAAFIADTDHFSMGGIGIFTGPDVFNDRVIQSGEMFGYDVRGRALGHGLNDAGQIAMIVRLDTPDSGSSPEDFIVLATPAPEPASALLMVSSLVGLAGLLRRR